MKQADELYGLYDDRDTLQRGLSNKLDPRTKRILEEKLAALESQIATLEGQLGVGPLAEAARESAATAFDLVNKWSKRFGRNA
jgi:hypothetical protein